MKKNEAHRLNMIGLEIERLNSEIGNINMEVEY